MIKHKISLRRHSQQRLVCHFFFLACVIIEYIYIYIYYIILYYIRINAKSVSNPWNLYIAIYFKYERINLTLVSRFLSCAGLILNTSGFFCFFLIKRIECYLAWRSKLWNLVVSFYPLYIRYIIVGFLGDWRYLVIKNGPLQSLHPNYLSHLALYTKLSHNHLSIDMKNPYEISVVLDNQTPVDFLVDGRIRASLING